MPQRSADKLAAYRAKRDFSRTAEPAGQAPEAVGPALRFVIQKHDATRLHYDLRLELDGVFKSWAVTKGPSLDPRDKRLAVEVEDHPLDYGDFEGTIPKGEYGGGTVMLWDRGTWSPEGMTAEEGLAKGDLKFNLEGEKLHGSWVLVRMKHDRSGGKRTNWLLIKHKDDFARPGDGETALGLDTSVASGRAMADIAAGTGRKPTPFITAGSSPASATMPDFIEPQFARSADRPPAIAGWVHEIKLDGYRMQLRVARGEAHLRTRTGLDWTDRFAGLARAAATLPDGIYDGEAVALDAQAKPDFALLQAALSGERTPLVFFMFDLLFADGIDLRDWTLADRKARLRDALAGADPALRYVEHFESGGDAVLLSACRMDLEGIVSKRLDAPYRSGRGDTWLKVKCRAGHEVVIGGWATTDGRFRSLLVGAHRGGKFVYLGRVGTGFGAAKLAALLPRLQAAEQPKSPFAGPNAPRAAGLHWTRPELVAEIEFAGWTGEGLVRQAAYKALREDKPAAEVEPETPPAAAPAPAAPAPKPGGNAVFGVTITRPDKPLWPEAGHDATPVTKLELARYYEAVADRLLPHIAGRPCSLLRYPDGIDGERFFQRHPMRGQSALIDVVDAMGDRQPYVELNRPEALAAAAQVGTLELHPWNNRPGERTQPGRLVFDLDPAPDVPFARVIEGALALRTALEAVGLVPFCKTTGGKGLHVVVPLAPRREPLEWPEAKAFARDICQTLADAQPDRYLIVMTKAKRTGRIFLDYLRNDRLATAVAPYSPRARAGATVSMPIAWSEVTDALDPGRYHLRSVPELVQAPDPWRGYAEAARALPGASLPRRTTGRAVTRK